MKRKNLTLSADASIIDEARALAISQGTTINSLFREFLEQFVQAKKGTAIDEFLRLAKEFQGDSKGWKFNRDEAYER